MATVRLNAALANSPQIIDGASKRFEALAASMQATTIYGDDVTKSQISQLAALGKTESEIKKLIDAAANLASATGVDLDTAVRQLNATLQGNAGILGRQNGEVRALSEEELKAGKAIEIVARQYAGYADKVGDSAYGATIKYNNAIGDLRENMGNLVAEGFKPLLENLTKYIVKINESTTNSRALEEFISKKTTENAQGALKALYDRMDVLKSYTGQAAAGAYQELENLKKIERELGTLSASQARTAKEREEIAKKEEEDAKKKADRDKKDQDNLEAKKKLTEEMDAAYEEWGDGVISVYNLTSGLNKELKETPEIIDDIIKKIDVLGSAWGDWTLQIGDTQIALEDIQNGFGSIYKVGSDMFDALSDLQSNQSDAYIKSLEDQRDQYDKNSEEYKAADERVQAAKNAAAEKEFNSQKASSIADAVIEGAVAAVKALAELGPIAGPIAATLIGGLVATQVAAISAQQYVPFATGGYVDQPTHALVGEAGGEWILNKSQMAGLAKNGIGGGGTTIVQNVYGSVWRTKDLERLAVGAVAKNSRGY